MAILSRKQVSRKRTSLPHLQRHNSKHSRGWGSYLIGSPAKRSMQVTQQAILGNALSFHYTIFASPSTSLRQVVENAVAVHIPRSQSPVCTHTTRHTKYNIGGGDPAHTSTYLRPSGASPRAMNVRATGMISSPTAS